MPDSRLERKNDYLTEDGDIFEDFFKYAADLLVVADFDGNFIKVNPAVIELLGYTEEELLTTPLINFVYEEDRDVTLLKRLRSLENEILRDYENRYITKSGNMVWLSWTSMPIKNTQTVFAIAKDITKKKRLEDEKARLFSEMKSMNKELEYFARVASHDLRTPVGNILSLFDLLDVSLITDPDNLRIIQLIKQSTKKVNVTLEKYINQLIHNELLTNKAEEVSISNVLKGVMNSMSVKIEQSNAQIGVDLNAFDTISFNQGYLESILLNLISNALKYRQAHLEPIIQIKSFYRDGIQQLSISDNGIGLNMELVGDKIFGLNQTFNGNLDAKGVGLYLVKKHVTEMGATIAISSEKNIGTTFTIGFKPT